MIQRAHGPGVNVQVRVNLYGSDSKAVRLHEQSRRRRNHALANARNHATTNDNVLDHCWRVTVSCAYEVRLCR